MQSVNVDQDLVEYINHLTVLNLYNATHGVRVAWAIVE